MTVLWHMTAFRKSRYPSVPFLNLPHANSGIDSLTEKDNMAKTSSRYGPRTLSDILKRLSTCIGDGSRYQRFRLKLSRIFMHG